METSEQKHSQKTEQLSTKSWLPRFKRAMTVVMLGGVLGGTASQQEAKPARVISPNSEQATPVARESSLQPERARLLLQLQELLVRFQAGETQPLLVFFETASLESLQLTPDTVFELVIKLPTPEVKREPGRILVSYIPRIEIELTGSGAIIRDKRSNIFAVGADEYQDEPEFNISTLAELATWLQTEDVTSLDVSLQLTQETQISVEALLTNDMLRQLGTEIVTATRNELSRSENTQSSTFQSQLVQPFSPELISPETYERAGQLEDRGWTKFQLPTSDLFVQRETQISAQSLVSSTRFAGYHSVYMREFPDSTPIRFTDPSEVVLITERVAVEVVMTVSSQENEWSTTVYVDIPRPFFNTHHEAVFELEEVVIQLPAATIQELLLVANEYFEN